ncbi:MAG TPA: hypothetical protein DHW55_08545, partial [Flavobacteriales bacterium]|nr:hypothetical protein [Flavobacteriales bacterium]
MPRRYPSYLCGMQLSLIAIGATSQPWVKDGVEMYNKRLSRYTKYQ